MRILRDAFVRTLEMTALDGGPNGQSLTGQKVPR